MKAGRDAMSRRPRLPPFPECEQRKLVAPGSFTYTLPPFGGTLTPSDTLLHPAPPADTLAYTPCLTPGSSRSCSTLSGSHGPTHAAQPPTTLFFAQLTVAGALMKIDEDGFIAFDEDADMREGARNVIEFAQAIMRHACIVHMPHNGLPATVRVGVHTGSVVRCVAAGAGRRCLGALGAREIAGANGLAPTAVHTHHH